MVRIISVCGNLRKVVLPAGVARPIELCELRPVQLKVMIIFGDLEKSQHLPSDV